MRHPGHHPGLSASRSFCLLGPDRPQFFGGSLGDLCQARKLAEIPLLRKDFIIDEYQVYQARVMGADAILLIAACLTPDQCLSLAELAHTLQLETLLEIHSESELGHLNPHIDMLGVNNRNLGTFHTDVENSFRLAEIMQEVSKEKDLAPPTGFGKRNIKYSHSKPPS